MLARFVTLKRLGLVFCCALAPKDLATPVLPYRDEGKLVFPLCRTCVETKNTAKCCHESVSDRCLTGVWCSDELQLALDKGYKILRYHEVWHWPDEKWFRGGFFASFMKPLLKQKHEASGWPRPDMTDEEKEAHIENIYLNDGVKIDGCKIALNPALRSLAKLFLNSTWGNFAMYQKNYQNVYFYRQICAKTRKGGSQNHQDQGSHCYWQLFQRTGI